MSGNFFWNYLNKIKNRPPHERELLALLWAGGVTLLIMIAWGFNILYFINAPDPKEVEENTASSSVWRDLTANIALVGEGLGVVRDEFRAILNPSK